MFTIFKKERTKDAFYALKKNLHHKNVSLILNEY